MLVRFGRVMARRARWVLCITVIVLGAAIALGVGAFGVLKGQGGFDDPASESVRAGNLLEKKFDGGVNVVLLVKARGGNVDEADVARAGAALADRVRKDPSITSAMDYWQTHSPEMRSTDGSEALVVGHMMGNDEMVKAAFARFLNGYQQGDNAPITAKVGGPAAVNVGISQQVGDDLLLAESIAVPLTLLLLVLAFGSLVAAALPVVIGVVAIWGTFAVLAVLGRVTDVSVFSINLTTALGLGLGIDYGLLLVARFRERLAAGAQVQDAVAETVATAGRTILFSAATVAVALTALLFFPLYFLRTFAYAGIGVVVIAAGSAITVIPALLALLGRRVNAGRVPGIRADRGSASPAWGRLAGGVMRRPIAAVPVLVLFALLASPLLGLTFGTQDETVLPPGNPIRTVSAELRTNYHGDQANAIPVFLDGSADPGAVANYATALSQFPNVAHVQSSAGMYAAGKLVQHDDHDAVLGKSDAQRFSVLTTLPGQSEQAQDLVRQIRAIPVPAGTTRLVGGDAAHLVDTKHVLGSRLPYAICAVILTTFLAMFLFTGSIVQPLRALILNTLGLAATLGAMVWIFQDGHLGGLLHLSGRPMEMAMTVLFFCIAFGLSMDYEVFVTSRIKELSDAGYTTERAVTEGLARTGRLVSIAAVLLCVNFFAFGTASVSFLQMFGIGCGLAILIDALLIRGILVPVSFRLLGRAAWWAPQWMRRLHNRVGISEDKTQIPVTAQR